MGLSELSALYNGIDVERGGDQTLSEILTVKTKRDYYLSQHILPQLPRIDCKSLSCKFKAIKK